MNDGVNPRAFWNARFGKVGHTGELNPLLYAYDQPQRLRAIDQALSRTRVQINSNTNVLDIGCGTGDVINLLMNYGEPGITGVDISDEAIAHARRRFAARKKVRLLTAGIEEVNFPSSSFDLVIGINVLQHITDEQAFLGIVEAIVRISKGNGHILVMDFSPVKVANRQPAPYVVYRSKREYIDAFEKAGCEFVSEFGLPRIGVRLYRAVGTFGGILRHLGYRARPATDGQLTNGHDGGKSPWRPHMGDFMRSLVLKIARPLDHAFAPFPSRFTDMRILIFQVASK